MTRKRIIEVGSDFRCQLLSKPEGGGVCEAAKERTCPIGG